MKDKERLRNVCGLKDQRSESARSPGPVGGAQTLVGQWRYLGNPRGTGVLMVPLAQWELDVGGCTVVTQKNVIIRRKSSQVISTGASPVRLSTVRVRNTHARGSSRRCDEV